MKKALFLALFLVPYFATAQVTSIVWVVNDTTYSEPFDLIYPSEIAVKWDYNGDDGKDVDSLTLERQTYGQWSGVTTLMYDERTESKDTVWVRGQSTEIKIPIHAKPGRFRLRAYATQDDTLLVTVRW